MSYEEFTRGVMVCDHYDCTNTVTEEGQTETEAKAVSLGWDIDSKFGFVAKHYGAGHYCPMHKRK